MDLKSSRLLQNNLQLVFFQRIESQTLQSDNFDNRVYCTHRQSSVHTYCNSTNYLRRLPPALLTPQPPPGHSLLARSSVTSRLPNLFYLVFYISVQCAHKPCGLWYELVLGTCAYLCPCGVYLWFIVSFTEYVISLWLVTVKRHEHVWVILVMKWCATTKACLRDLCWLEGNHTWKYYLQLQCTPCRCYPVSTLRKQIQKA